VHWACLCLSRVYDTAFTFHQHWLLVTVHVMSCAMVWHTVGLPCCCCCCCLVTLQTHPGKGVTTFIPDMVATHPRRSAGGSPRTLTTSSSSSGGGGLRLVIGNRRLMLEQQVSVGVEAQGFMQEHEAQARTCVLVGINGEVVAALAIADPLKPEAKAVVAALHAQVGRGWATWGPCLSVD